MVITSCTDVVEMAPPHLNRLSHEEAWVLYLKAGNRTVALEMVARGTVSKIALDNRSILRQALLYDATAIVLLHNHPSGKPKPSREDVEFTDRLHSACKLMNIDLLDHIILSEESYFSFAEAREIKYNN